MYVSDNVRGSGCGSVGRAVASATRGPWFKSNYRRIFNVNICLLILKCIEKDESKEKRYKEWFILITISVIGI